MRANPPNTKARGPFRVGEMIRLVCLHYDLGVGKTIERRAWRALCLHSGGQRDCGQKVCSRRLASVVCLFYPRLKETCRPNSRVRTRHG